MQEDQPEFMESEAYRRWEKIRIGQLGYTTNLILGLAVGVLAFETNMVVGHAERFHAGPWWLALPSILSAAVSVVLGLAAAINRLQDFRVTSKIYRETADPKKIKEEREKTFPIGERTWKLLHGQLITFLISVVVSVLWLVGLVYGRIT